MKKRTFAQNGFGADVDMLSLLMYSDYKGLLHVARMHSYPAG
jgi:hypothetical protein